MARRRWLAVFLAAGLVLATGAIPAAGAKPDPEIRLIHQRFTPPAGVPEVARQAIARRAEELRARGKERLHLLVQLHELPSPGGRRELARQGLDLGAFVPGLAFIAAVPVGRAVAAVARPEVRWATLWDTGHKLHPRVTAGDWGPWARDPARPGMIAAMLLLHHDVPLAAGPVLAAKVGGVAMPTVEGLHGMTVWLPQTRVAELAAEEEVLWIEEAPPPLTPTNDGVRSGLRATGLADPPYGLTGSGVRLFVFDDGTVRRTHQTFDPGTGSRVTLIDGTPMSSHATHVAGTAAGDGSGSASDRGRGVAPGVSVLSAGYEQVPGTQFFLDNAGDLEADYARARTVHQADLGTNSLGSNTAHNGYPCEREGDYGVSSSLIDNIVHGTNAAVGSPVFMTWSAGNERNAGDIPGRCGSHYGTTAPPSCAKNPLHVGAVNSDGLSMTEFSSWGPCDDGRLKPTLVAPGCETGLVSGETGVFSSTAGSDSAYGVLCGTSMATPAVAGVASLLTQAWREMGLGGPTERPLPALIKALLIHTARDLGPEGPDYVYGYGAVDAKAAIDLLRENDTFTGGWIIGTVGQGEIEEHSIDGPWQDLDEVKVTLVWDDPAAAPFAAEALVNDLSLESTGYPYTTTHQPWVLAPAGPHLRATRGVDSRNNVEQIVVRDAPMSDTLMRVIGTRVPSGPQTYALVFSFKPVVVDKTACTATSSTFETGTDGWTLAGAARTPAPASGHGTTSVRLGGDVDTFHEATRSVVVPSAPRVELTFWWAMTTEESLDLFGFGFDPFTAEIRNVSGAVLALVDLRNDGWPQGRWLQQRIDLTPWAGQTVTLAFTGTNDFEAATTFWIDDVTVTSCPNICNTNGSTTNITVNPVDDPPIAVDDAATVAEDSGANAINVLANDTDPDGGPSSIASVTQPANGTVAITGCGTGLIYAPNANYCNTLPGTTLDTFVYTLTPGGSTATVSVTVTCVEDDPTAVADAVTVTEDSPSNPIDVLANDTDPDGGPFSNASVTQPANGTVVIISGGMGLTYTPNANYCNSPPGTTPDTFTYTLTPGGSTAIVSATVTCVDDNPTAVNDSANVFEDSGANGIDVLANDTDVDGGPISITSVTQPANGTVWITNGGTDLTHMPNANYCNNPPGTTLDTFNYSLAPGGSTTTVTVTVTCLNDGPVIDLDANDDKGTVGNDFAVTFTEGDAAKLIEDPVDATVTDVDSPTLASLTVTLTNLLDTGNETLSADVTGTSITANYVTGPGTGTLTLTGPDTVANFQTVLRTVRYLNTDNAPDATPRVVQFVANDGTTNGNTAISTVTVVSVDTAPTAVNDSATVNEDSGATAIDVLANDTDPDGGPISITSVTQPTNGTVVITGGGTGLTYQPNANYCNDPSGTPDTFIYTLTPGGSTATVSVTVTCVNDAPTLATNPITYTTPGNTQLHVAGATLAGVASWSDASSTLAKSSPSDVDGPGPLQVVAASGSSTNGGSFSISTNGSFTYVPPVGFTGTDSFTYAVTDNGTPAATVTGTINITVGQRVWYIRDVIDANNAAGGDGRSSNAFDSIAAFNAATTNDGDIVFVFEGNTGTTPLTGSISLRNGQKLWGQGIALDVPGFGTTLVSATNKPRIRTTTASTDVVSVPATAGNRNNVEIRGLDLEATGATSNAIDVTSSGANNVSVTINSNNVRGATAEGIDVNANSAGTATIAIHDNTQTSNGTAIDITRTAGTLVITALGNNVISGDTAGNGIVVTGPATFDATPGGALNPVNGGVTVIGVSGNPITGAGLALGNVTGALDFADLDVFAGSTGVVITGTGAFTGAAGMRVTVPNGVSVLQAGNGPGVDVSNATIDLRLASLTVSASPTTGVSLVNVSDGTVAPASAFFSAGSGSTIANVNGTDFNVNGGNATISYGGSINNNTAGRSVAVQNRTGDSVTFTSTSTITDNRTGILVNANAAGAVTDFLGTLTLNTGANAAFVATNGGTLRVMGAANTITTTTGVALNVTNTTIGTGSVAPETGLRFRSIAAGTAASGPANGIVLNNTGASGSLTVTGTGAAGSGGTIQRTTSHGVLLTTISSPSFTSMSIQNTGGSGVKGTRVTSFTFVNGSIDNSGTAAGDSNIAFNDSAAGTESNLSGTVTITGNTLTNAFYHGVDLQNFSGSLTDVNISSNTITSSTSAASSNGSGIRLIANGSATTVSNVTKATLSNNVISNFPSGSGIRVQGGNANASGPSGTLGVAGNAASIISITGNRVAGASATSKIGLEGILATVSGKGQGNFEISSNGTVANPIANVAGTAISVNALGAATVTATVSNNFISPDNTFGTNGVAAAVNSFFGLTDAPDLTVTITNNTISAVDGNGILAVARNSNGILRARIQNNTVAAPLTGLRPGIRVDSGTTSGNTTVCLNLSGNTSAGSGGSQGIGLRKQGTAPVTNAFGVNGMAATSSPGVEAYVDGLNPAGGGTLLISGTSGFTNCSLP